MKRLATIACVAVLGSTIGCGSTKNETLHYSFEFDHEGVDYQIISVVAPDDRGHNFLTRREAGRVVFSAKDEDQNGTIDAVLIGDVDLAVANDIYSSGISAARAGNKYRELHGARAYSYTISGESYVVNSLSRESEGSFYNTFVFSDGYGGEVVAVDEDADGTLDRVKKGVADLTASTELYLMVLEQGVRDGKVVSEEGRYLVGVN